MEIFNVWRPDICNEDEAQKVNATDARDAAEKLYERNFPNWDYCMDAEISVRDAAGVKTEWSVDVRTVPEFYAYPKKVKAKS